MHISFWGVLGPLGDPLGDLLGAPWGPLGGLLEPTWGPLGAARSLLGTLGTTLGPPLEYTKTLRIGAKGVGGMTA